MTACLNTIIAEWSADTTYRDAHALVWGNGDVTERQHLWESADAAVIRANIVENGNFCIAASLARVPALQLRAVEMFDMMENHDDPDGAGATDLGQYVQHVLRHASFAFVTDELVALVKLLFDEYAAAVVVIWELFVPAWPTLMDVCTDPGTSFYDYWAYWKPDEGLEPTPHSILILSSVLAQEQLPTMEDFQSRDVEAWIEGCDDLTALGKVVLKSKLRKARGQLGAVDVSGYVLSLGTLEHDVHAAGANAWPLVERIATLFGQAIWADPFASSLYNSMAAFWRKHLTLVDCHFLRRVQRAARAPLQLDGLVAPFVWAAITGVLMCAADSEFKSVVISHSQFKAVSDAVSAQPDCFEKWVAEQQLASIQATRSEVAIRAARNLVHVPRVRTSPKQHKARRPMYSAVAEDSARRRALKAAYAARKRLARGAR